MYLHGCSHDEGLEHVPLDLLHQQHPTEHDESGDRTVVNEGDEHREDAREHSPNNRDERTEENGDRDGNDEGKPEKKGEETDADRIDRGHEDLHFDEGGQGHPSCSARAVDGLASLGREQLNNPEPDSPAVDQHEQGGEENKQDARQQVPGCQPETQGTGHQRPTVRLNGAHSLRDEVREIRF